MWGECYFSEIVAALPSLGSLLLDDKRELGTVWLVGWGISTLLITITMNAILSPVSYWAHDLSLSFFVNFGIISNLTNCRNSQKNQ